VASVPSAASHAAAARKVTIRLMLKAALAKTKSASTVMRPRSFTLRSPAIVLSHANARSMRGRAVLEAAAKKAEWKPGARSDGTRGRGVAYSRYETIKAYVAVVVDVAVDRASGQVKVERVTAAVDSGQIINTDGLTNQIEGGIIQGVSWTLKEAVKFDRQKITTRDWASYPILTFSEVPAVDVVLIDRPEQRSLGSGEASQGPTPAAIANAIFHATGARLRDLPFTPDRVKAAIQRG